MKTIKTLAVVLLVMLSGIAMTAQAQLRVGVKAGMLQLAHRTYETGSRTGFTAGMTTEFTVPIVGIGFDLSAMYVHRNTDAKDQTDWSGHRDYIEVPLNVKWKINIPIVGSLIKPYLATGPSASFLLKRQSIKDAIHNKSVAWAWNVGFGAEILKRLQIGARYGWSISNITEVKDGSGTKSFGLDPCWTITAAYFF